MKDDTRKFVPDVARLIREMHPAAVRARREKAVEKLRAEGLLDRSTPPPDAAPAQVATVAKPAARRRATLALFVGFALLAVAAPLAVLLAGWLRTPKVAMALPDATTAPGALTSASARAAAVPGATVAAAVPSATATTAPSATAAPTATATASPAPPKSSQRRSPPRQGSDNPYDAAPPPAATVAPAPPEPMVPPELLH